MSDLSVASPVDAAEELWYALHDVLRWGPCSLPRGIYEESRERARAALVKHAPGVGANPEQLTPRGPSDV